MHADHQLAAHMLLGVAGEEMRPVQLRTVVKAYSANKNDFLFERRLNTFLYGVLQENSSGKPGLIFCRSVCGALHQPRVSPPPPRLHR